MYILAIDQGTTGTTTIAYDSHGKPLVRSYREIRQYYPKPGWVEHDAEEIWQSVVDTANEVVAQMSSPPAAIGITNQRETTVLWDRDTGKPVHRAIVWQCRRSADICTALNPHERVFREKTGLPLDPYFSGTKIHWLLEHGHVADPARTSFGTIDSWLVWKLTGGKVHATDFTNASRTLLFNLHTRDWDSELCSLLEIPESILPEVHGSVSNFGTVHTIPSLEGVSIHGLAGDQQAALVGQTCFQPGEMKNTYGTGCFMLMNTGQQPIVSDHGLLTTLAVGPEGESCFALEGAVFVAGAAIQWLRDELGLIDEAAQSEELALSVPDTAGVYLVPAGVSKGLILAIFRNVGASGAFVHIEIWAKVHGAATF